MTTTKLAPASPPPVLDFDARLALVGAVMGARLDQAAVAFEVNTAHIEGADPIPAVADVVPLTPTLPPSVCPYGTPVAALLWRARVRIERDGWGRQLRDDQGLARCPAGAIQIEASTASDDAGARRLLFEAIQRDFRDVESIPSWNDAQAGPRLPLLYLDRAAALADARHL
ncbi:hypothetical protein ACIRU8_39400 [Streptomyces sp. NPDC101175]|uniref:DUF6197 family protein n=1 Tax=Streptomyces sp. NPDC101175 TaxID=3366123 RepID=UPI003836C53C